VSTFTTSLSDPPTSSDAVTFEVTTNAAPGELNPTGTVTILIDGSPVANVGLTGGVAFYTSPPLSVGDHTVTAHYTSNSANFVNSVPTEEFGVTQLVGPSANAATASIVPNATVPAGSFLSPPFAPTSDPTFPMVVVVNLGKKGKKTMLLIVTELGYSPAMNTALKLEPKTPTFSFWARLVSGT
jgi:hypothetical protein